MKVLTIKQPWASLIVHGIKNLENRSWYPNYTGPILIHAAKKGEREGWECLDDVQRQIVMRHISMIYDTPFEELPFGKIIGQVNLTRAVKRDYYDPWAINGLYKWVLEDPIKFDTPISVKGQLRFWNYDIIKEDDKL